MRFESLSVTNLRCLKHYALEPDPGRSLIVGENGSGKTSLLEAFALAAQGKSFLTHRTGDLVTRGEAGLQVRAVVRENEEPASRIVVGKEAGETRISMNGESVLAASVLARTVPLLVINSQAAELLTGGPSNRRALVDRTMFHVERGYVDTWKDYRQALRQRNMLLRRQARSAEAGFWNETLDRLGGAIDRARRVVVERLNERLEDAELLSRFTGLAFEYRSGWARDRTLLEALEQSWDRDLALGHTIPGPHRADLTLKMQGQTVGQRLSRGQAKAVVCTVVAETVRFIAERTSRWPVLLVDDLPAELDDNTRREIVDMIESLGSQRLYTAVKAGVLPEIADRGGPVFHVEHGQAAPVA